MALADNLKQARTRKGLKQEELAKLVGKSKNVISNWERGDNKPDADTLFELCDILNVDANFLLGWEDNQNLSLSIQEQDHIKKYRSLDSLDKKAIDVLLDTLSKRQSEQAAEFIQLESPMLLPYYGRIVSAGTGQYVFDDIPPEMIEIESNHINMQADFAVGVNGDSMEPTYKDGDVLLIKKQPSVNVGEIGIFMIDGEAFVKELGHNVLVSHNPKYAPIPFSESISCIGKVLGKV